MQTIGTHRPHHGTPTTTLNHELQHASDFAQGIFNPNQSGIGTAVDGITIPMKEYRAVQAENVFRANTGMELRSTYGDFTNILVPGHDYRQGLPPNMPQ